jgi:hypothetical protein
MEISLNLLKNIQNLNCDLQQKILGYTYSPQSKELLYDIQDCRFSLDYTKEYYFSKYMVEIENFYEKTDLNWLLDDIFEYISNNIFRIDYYEFWRRVYMLRNMPETEINGYVANVFFQKDIEIQINILWGILTPEERGDVIYFGIELIETDSELEDDHDF